LYRDGAPCELCVGKAFALPGVRHGCYRESPAATLAVATMTATHRALGTWQRAVDRYIAITDFARGKFVQGGLPEHKLVVKPNPLSYDPGMGENGGGFALFVGRLGTGKGVEVMLEAWRREAGLPPLVVVGDGPLAPLVEAAHVDLGDRVQWLGWREHDDVIAMMKEAAVMVFPSQVYEGGTPMSIVEAQACGLPVVASDRGAMKTMVADGETGYRFSPTDPDALARAVHLLVHQDHGREAMRHRARTAFTTTYAPDVNVRRLVAIYHEALAERRARA
ncbi:MAG: glycosyltransferase family 4 protein, partial [Bacteroidota bacterium]